MRSTAMSYAHASGGSWACSGASPVCPWGLGRWLLHTEGLPPQLWAGGA